MKWVVDASVAAKWLAPEDDSARALEYLNVEVLAPDLLFAEVANILWKKFRRGEIAPEVPQAAARAIQLLAMRVEPSSGLAVDAVKLAMRLDHPAYDCFYLALALRTGSPLITADRRFYERCQQPDAMEFADVVHWLGTRSR